MDNSEPDDSSNNKPEKEDQWMTTIRFYLEEVKELVTENGKFRMENEQLNEQVKELQEELKQEHEKSNGVRVRKYLNVILTLVFIVLMGKMIF